MEKTHSNPVAGGGNESQTEALMQFGEAIINRVVCLKRCLHRTDLNVLHFIGAGGYTQRGRPMDLALNLL